MNNNPNTPTRSTVDAQEGQTTADIYSFRKPRPLPVCHYNRKQTLAEGLQMEVPSDYLRKLDEDWDMLLPDRVFLTKEVVESCQLPDGLIGNEEQSRLWHILNVLECAIGNSFQHRIPFEVSFWEWRPANLHAVWSTADIDDPTPSITIMLPKED